MKGSSGDRVPVSQPAVAPSGGVKAGVQSDPVKEERERGNALFAKGDFAGAVKCYTRWGKV